MSVNYTEVLADLRQRRDKLIAAIQAIEEIMGAAHNSGPIVVRPAIAHLSRPGTVASLAHDVIEQSGGPMKVGDVTRALEDMGKFKTPGRANYATVYGALDTDPRFVKVGEGMFELCERMEDGGPDRKPRRGDAASEVPTSS